MLEKALHGLKFSPWLRREGLTKSKSRLELKF
ncbi:hypothetical protein OIU74_010170 [Salix koriyanagi]|uniref:Uncharacterized protein n=2 Tax=Salix TaxID=40685 RepID=A0A9Q0QME6_9ROSI|nr:hypothetical protein OIU84_013585 [Salix udensis]KAJ6709012.1 hypothetical protein OIU74_010170 [Salix koriyanagi]